MIIFDVLFYLGLSVLWVHSEPMIELKRSLGFKDEEYDNFSKRRRVTHRLITCLYCSSFWITLTLTLNIQMAVVVSLMAYILDRNKL